MSQEAELGPLSGRLLAGLLALPHPHALRALAARARDTQQGQPSSLDHY